ncbi:MAG TPA: TAT-variant-translocated molybdopterin oxidoreductase [Urbifossiella sp.]|nr:TAT-variant-translocated molybdopterin oxidoreductase [Urbifossiella sp.]
MPPEANDTNAAPNPPQLWRGLEEYMDSPAFREAMADEFPEDAAEWTDPVSRRSFISIMGAGLALAGAAGCTPRPAAMRKIVPYTRQPEQMIPGVPLFFASAAPLAGYATGVLVRSHEGRPVKIEGNPDHPSSLGGTGPIDQASVLDLYDPDRSPSPTRSGVGTTLDEAVRAARGQLFDAAGQPKAAVKLRVLTGAVTSPTLADRVTALLGQFPQAKWVQYEACGQDNAREGAKKAFGRDLAVHYDFTKADVVLSLDADFLGEGPGHARYCRDFASRRRVRTAIPVGGEHDYVKPEDMSRLYVAECMPSQTGSVADHRLPILAGQVEAFARAVAAKLGVAGVPAAGPLPEAAQKWVDPLAKDLLAKKGKGIVVAGAHQPAAVQALALAINGTLGNLGQTVHVTAPVEARPDGKMLDLGGLVREMAAKQVDVLLILGGTNPVYTAPADADFAGALKNVPFRFHLGSHQDETAGVCEWHINEAHYLETWGDARGHDGTVALQQPLIAPLYNGRSAAEVLALVTQDTAPQPGQPKETKPTEGYDIVRAYWQKRFADEKRTGPFEPAWQEVVRMGVVPNTAAAKQEKPALAGSWAEGASPAYPAPASDEYEINFRPDPTLFDGRFANNGWLQELPKPVTKISWDNAAFVSAATAKKLNAEKDFRWTGGERGRTEVSVITLTYGGRSIKLPVWILPGHPDGAVTVHLGHGRERAGKHVGNNPDQQPNAEGKQAHGSNAYALRTAAAPAFGLGLKLAKTSDSYFVACTQAYWVMTQVDPLNGTVIDRAPVRRGTAEDYKKNPWFAKIPPTAAGETGLISQNIPGQAGPSDPDSGAVKGRGTTYGPGHDHGHDHKDGDKHGGHEHHDDRLVPLTMYNPNDRLYPEGSRGPNRRWGMAFDLSACTGCNACVVACQSENNTPTVGKHEVTRGHDMYWIRIDRYYEGTPNEPDATRTYFQPVPCQQCEKAPCEIVCPVAATTHTADGLNDMVYNRCVGTRYCSNNCPYKVRRFNFLTFQDWYTDSIKLGRNPDVSVRSRGVMEKCTYCVQRIRYAEIVAEREHRPIRDGEVRTACQSACPSGAIMFGDLGDPASQVGKWKAEPANYGLLAELNTMPRTSYLATLRNPNPELVAATGKG